MIRVALHGARGRMGRAIDALAQADASIGIETRIDSSSSSTERETLAAADVIVDFTDARGLEQLVRELAVQPAHRRLPAVVSGSTGLDSAARVELEHLAARTPILWAPNFSLGVYLFVRALRAWSGSPALNRFQTFIHDLHHIGKKDAPSGTALLLQDALGTRVPIESRREGEVLGRHEVRLVGAGETLSLVHDVQDRKVFAEGALFAARELASRRNELPRRLLTLDDLLA